MNGPVEREGDGDAGPLVRVEDARLRADDEAILAGLADPFDVVAVLDGYVVRQALAHDRLEHLLRDPVRRFEVLRAAGGADPAERAEAQREDVPVRARRVANERMRAMPDGKVYPMMSCT